MQGHPIRSPGGSFDRDALAEAARQLHRDDLVVVHLPEGAFALGDEGELGCPRSPSRRSSAPWAPATRSPRGCSTASTRSSWLLQCLDLGHLAAVACIGHATTTGGLRPVSEL